MDVGKENGQVLVKSTVHFFIKKFYSQFPSIQLNMGEVERLEGDPNNFAKLHKIG